MIGDRIDWDAMFYGIVVALLPLTFVYLGIKLLIFKGII
jgi:hypothetical protein